MTARIERNLGSGNDGSGVGGGGDVCHTPPEYRHPVYCNSYDTGAMSGGGATSGSAGDTELVGSDRNQLRARVRERGGEDMGVGGREGEGERIRDGSGGEAGSGRVGV